MKRKLVAVFLLGLLPLGCVTPWAGHDVVELPTAQAIPTTTDPVGKLEPADPSLPEVEISESPIEAAPASESDKPDQAVATEPGLVVRGQTPGQGNIGGPDSSSPTGSYGQESPSSGTWPTTYGDGVRKEYGSPAYGAGGYGSGLSPSGYDQTGYPGSSSLLPQSPAQGYGPAYSTYDGSGVASPYGGGPPADGLLQPLPADYADLVVNLRETQTGRFMFGVGVNSDLGLTAQATIDERNFDWRRWPRSLSEITNGTAWRGGGQSLRIEAVPGTEVQRYMVNFTQPYLFDTLPISFNVSGYLFDRRYFDWDEQRVGGRVGLGYRITPDLSLSVALRGEQVDFHNPRIRGIPIIEDALGESDLFSGRVSLVHDTRDIPFAPTEGHYLELGYEHVFGSYDYPRANLDYRRYFLLKQRVDRSGRHTLGFSFKGGITGSDTPVFENYFAGGYSTMRGFRFRHASPKIFDVIVGGQLSLLGSVEYIFPVTADDMLRGAVFCDYGTIEETYDNIEMEDFRVAVGAGLRVNIPAMGPAPIAVDFAIPINRESTDRIQNFSFSVGVGR